MKSINLTLIQPLQYSIFRMLWLTALISNIGTWMNDIGAAWLMTSLTNKIWLVALVQAATALPIFCLSLVSGALADILDRRNYLICLQTWMCVIAGCLALITYFGKISPELLLILVFCLGIGTALSLPTWFAIIPELVPQKVLSEAITLNSVAINIARAVGPAVAGAIIAIIGPAAVFAINSLSFLGIIISLNFWKRVSIVSTLPAERLFGAIRLGLRFVKSTPEFINILIHACGFFLFASAVWALAPLIVRINLRSGSLEFGLLMSMIGLGAALGSIGLAELRKFLNLDHIVLIGNLAFIITLLILGLSTNLYLDCIGMFLGGLAWISVVSTFSTLIVQMTPPWLRARGTSVYLMIFFGNMVIGSAIWGSIASHFSISFALLAAMLCLIVATILTYNFKLVSYESIDHTLRGYPHLELANPPKYEQGPVMVTVEYFVESENTRSFAKTMRQMCQLRKRHGAFFWQLFNDVKDPHHFVECFMTESWVDHLREHTRATETDLKIQQRAKKFHKGEKKPLVSHWVSYDLPKKK